MERLRILEGVHSRLGRLADQELAQHLCNGDLSVRRRNRREGRRSGEDDLPRQAQFGKYYLNPAQWNDHFKNNSSHSKILPTGTSLILVPDNTLAIHSVSHSLTIHSNLVSF